MRRRLGFGQKYLLRYPGKALKFITTYTTFDDRRAPMRLLLGCFGWLLPVFAQSAEISVQLDNAPASGNLVFQVYDSPSAFGDFRNPVTETTVAARGPGKYVVTDVTPGEVALLVYADPNENGQIDKNFIGIPREQIGLSNNYRPKGPPNFERAQILVVEPGLEVDIELFKVLGERGRFGVGVGVIGRSSPYTNSGEDVVQPIPAMTYVGERLQWFGPTLRYGILGSGSTRLALAADYRIGSYEQDDAEILNGLGDRESTLLMGLSVEFELPAGADLSAVYQHDVLNNIGGGQASVRLSRGFQVSTARFEPQVQINWVGKDMSSHDFGVSTDAATATRPAYELDSTVSFELGVNSFIELTQEWRLIFNVSTEFLDSDVTDSPIVEKDKVFKGFAAITYAF